MEKGTKRQELRKRKKENDIAIAIATNSKIQDR